MAFQHVLVTTDFSTESEVAINYLLKSLISDTKKVTLLNVMEGFSIPVVGSPMGFDPAVVENYREQVEAHNRKKLAEIKTRFPAEVVVEVKILTTPLASVAQEVCDLAKKAGCDLIVMASHGAGVLTNLFIGSTVQRVIKLSACPVLVIPRGR